MSKTPSTPTEYIANLAPELQIEITQIDQFIRDTVPQLNPFIVYGMLGYGPYHYKYASGREGDSAIVSLAARKNYISIYVCAGEGGEYLAEKYKHTLGKASVGKSCIRYKRLEDIDWEGLKNVLIKAEQASHFPQNFMM